MKAFRFCPELIEVKDDVIVALSDAGYEWLSDYSSVDLCHDLYGIEVCGIRREEDAAAIKELLAKLFPQWKYYHCWLKDFGLEPGWEVWVYRDPETSE